MQDFSTDSIMQMWKKEYSSHLNKNSKFGATEQFNRIAQMCAPGDSYYYILNVSDFSLDYIHPNVEKVIGIKHHETSMEKLLSTALPEEMENILKKEKITSEFFYSHLNQDDYLSYKIMYTYKCTGLKGKLQIMMLQWTPISLSDSGKIQHVFGIHTDISHLGNVTTDWVSFISLNGKKSYLNIKAKNGRFDPKLANIEKKRVIDNLTKREKEIVKLMSQGLSAKAISEKLFISFNTTRTHRKNILFKTNCSNTAELMTKYIGEGLI